MEQTKGVSIELDFEPPTDAAAIFRVAATKAQARLAFNSARAALLDAEARLAAAEVDAVAGMPADASNDAKRKAYITRETTPEAHAVMEAKKARDQAEAVWEAAKDVMSCHWWFLTACRDLDQTEETLRDADETG